jgi:signal transduction histidine kinase
METTTPTTSEFSRSGRNWGLPLGLFLAGAALTFVVWWRTVEDWKDRASAFYAAAVQEHQKSLSSRVAGHLQGLNHLAGFWTLYGLKTEEVWRYDAEMIMANFPGIAWIAWVDHDTDASRFASADSTRALSPEVVQLSRERAESPHQPEMFRVHRGHDEMVVSLPIRVPAGGVGTLTAGLAPQQLFNLESAGKNLSYSVRPDSGSVLFESGAPAKDFPKLFDVELDLTQFPGETWRVHYRPTEESLRILESGRASHFLPVGLLLSAALGIIALQLNRLRTVSQALEVSSRELEMRVASRTTELHEAVHELETFSHSISHDLRSPIGAVLNLAAILEEDYADRLTEEGVRLLRRIRTSAESATHLLDQLGQFAWIGREEESNSLIDMRMVAREAYGEAIAAQGVNGETVFQIGDLHPAWGDPVLVGRVFRNLFSNALKYSRTREVRRIEVGSNSGPQENTYFVRDNGVGFNPEYREALFEPFRRLHPSKDFEGTGLGLAITAKILRRQRGKIWAESDGVNGATFSFTMPKEGFLG